MATLFAVVIWVVMLLPLLLLLPDRVLQNPAQSAVHAVVYLAVVVLPLVVLVVLVKIIKWAWFL